MCSRLAAPGLLQNLGRWTKTQLLELDPWKMGCELKLQTSLAASAIAACRVQSWASAIHAGLPISIPQVRSTCRSPSSSPTNNWSPPCNLSNRLFLRGMNSLSTSLLLSFGLETLLCDFSGVLHRSCRGCWGVPGAGCISSNCSFDFAIAVRIRCKELC